MSLHWFGPLKGPKKHDCAAVAVAHRIYCFGGRDFGDTDRNLSCHVFDTVTLRWLKLSTTMTGGGKRPPMRRRQAVVLIEDTTIFIWGGLYTNGSLYALHVDTHVWSKPEVSGNVPKRSEAACSSGKVIYVYERRWKWLFGMRWKWFTHGVYKLDTATMVWTVITFRGTLPPPSPSLLSGGSATIIGTKMFVCVCQDIRQRLNISVFDTETNIWLNLPPQISYDLQPFHSAFAYNGKLYIVCGDGYRNLHGIALWEFSPGTSSWKRVTPKGRNPYSMDVYPDGCIPRCRRSELMIGVCCCVAGDRVVLFGDNSVDLHVLDLSPTLKTLCKLAVIRCGLEQSGLPHNIRWELAEINKAKLIKSASSDADSRSN